MKIIIYLNAFSIFQFRNITGETCGQFQHLVENLFDFLSSLRPIVGANSAGVQQCH